MKTRILPASFVKAVGDDGTYQHILCAPRRRNQVMQNKGNAVAK